MNDVTAQPGTAVRVSSPAWRPGRRAGVGAVALLIAVVAVVVVLVRPGQHATPAVVPPAPTAPARAAAGASALSWAPTYMADTHVYTEAQAVALARRFDIVAGVPAAFRQYSGAMHAANPHLTLLVYTNGTFSTPQQAPSLPEAWFAHDAQGRRITSLSFGNFLMEPTSPGWRDYTLKQCVDKAHAGGDDGCLVDMLTMAVFSPRYVTAPPVDATTGRPYTAGTWRDGLVQLAQAFRALPGVVVAGNTVTSTNRFLAATASSRPISQALQLAQDEDFLRGSGDAATDFPSVTQWQDALQVVRDLESAGTRVLVSTKVWVPLDAAQRDQWQRYSMASFLLASNGSSAFAYTSVRTPQGAAQTNDRYFLPAGLGAPTGPAVQQGGLYVRPFQHGTVAVNPTDSAAELHTPATLRDLDGRTATSFPVAAHDATVLQAP